MVEAALDKIAFEAKDKDDNLLLIDTNNAKVGVPAALDLNESYEETEMNPNGFFADKSDQVR